MPDRPTLVLVGGFLGAGKTTLLLRAARLLHDRGLRAAIITNDQGGALVDTRMATAAGFDAGEIAGACFCCRFGDFIAAAHSLLAVRPDVIFAEPVGSCTDIVATVLRPFQEQHAYRIAPFTVLVDPGRAESLLEAEGDATMRFLFEKQVEEADLLCYTKADLYPVCPSFPGRSVRQLCAATGQGVAAWLREVLSGTLPAGRESLKINYERYAQAEAALAWLNMQTRFEAESPLSPAMLLGPLLDSVDRGLTVDGIGIVHLKGLVTSPTGFVKAALCGNGEEPRLEGNLDASPSLNHEILLNLRAVGPPVRVHDIVEATLRRLGGRLDEQTFDCFSPAAPVPERRIL